MRQPVPLFSRWLSVTFFSLTVVLALGLISVCWAKEELDRAIRQARGNIRELSTALEREPKAEKAEQRKAALEEYQAQLKQLLGQRFPEIQQAIKGAEDDLQQLRAKAKKSQGEHRPEIENKLHQAEKQLVKYRHLLEERLANLNNQPEISAEERVRQLEGSIKELEYVLEHRPKSEKRKQWSRQLEQNRRQLDEIYRKNRRKPERPGKQLQIIHLKYAQAGNLAEIISAFLSKDGVVVADQDTDSVVVRDTGEGVETAMAIVKALDIPKARKHRREHGKQEKQKEDEDRVSEEVFFGQLLKKQDGSITIKTRDGQEEVNLWIPIGEDGKLVDDFVQLTDQLEIGAMIKVRWQWRKERRWLRGLDHFEPEPEN